MKTLDKNGLEKFKKILDGCVLLITDPTVDNQNVRYYMLQTLSGQPAIMPALNKPVPSLASNARKILRDMLKSCTGQVSEDIIEPLLTYMSDLIKDEGLKVQGEETPEFPDVDGPIECIADLCPSTEYIPSIDQVLDLQECLKREAVEESEIFNVLRDWKLEDHFAKQFCKDVALLHDKHGDDYFPSHIHQPSSLGAIKACTAFRSKAEEAQMNRDAAFAEALVDKVKDNTLDEPELIIDPGEPEEGLEDGDLLAGINLTPKTTNFERSGKGSFMQRALEAQKLLSQGLRVLEDLIVDLNDENAV